MVCFLYCTFSLNVFFFFFQAEDGIRDIGVTGVQTCALPISALPSYLLFLIWFRVYIGKLRYTYAGIWFIAWAIPLFGWQLGLWAWISVILPLADRKSVV